MNAAVFSIVRKSPLARATSPVTTARESLAPPSPASAAPRLSPRRDAAAAAAFALTIGAFASSAPLADVFGWTALVLASTVVGIVAWRYPAARAPLLVAFAARAAVVLTQTYVVSLPGSDVDAVRFEAFASYWSQGTLADVLQRFSSGTYLYSWIVAVFYWLGGRSPMMAESLNALFGTLIVLNVFKLATLLRDERAGRAAAWVAALFPTMVLFSALTMREVAVSYPLTLGALYLARWQKTHRLSSAVGAMLAFAAAVAFHIAVIGIIAVALAVIAAASLSSLLRGRVMTALKALTGLGIAAAAAAVIVTSRWGNVDYVRSVSLQEVRFQQEVAAIDRAAYLQGFHTTSPTDLLWQAPIRAVYFVFTPFPWWVRTPLDVLGLIDVLLFTWLLWKVARGIRFVWRDPAARTVLVVYLSCVFVFAMPVSNYGTAIRHRGKTAPFVIPLAFAAVRRRERASTPETVLQP